MKNGFHHLKVLIDKLNVDGIFLAADGTAGAVMILRDHEGAVNFAACQELFNCADPLEAELAAMEEGLRLALHWSYKPIMVESDCQDVVFLTMAKGNTRARYAHRIKEINMLLS
jgi:ribonuclease HI